MHIFFHFNLLSPNAHTMFLFYLLYILKMFSTDLKPTHVLGGYQGILYQYQISYIHRDIRPKLYLFLSRLLNRGADVRRYLSSIIRFQNL